MSVEVENYTFVIPVRLGSSRIFEKVMLNFPRSSKYNLIEHKVMQIRKNWPNAKIMLSCGEERLYQLADKLNIDISKRVGKHKNGHEVGTRESICEVIKDVSKKYVAWTTVVTPLHDHVVLCKAVQEFEKALGRGFDSLTTGVRVYEYLWQDNKPLNYFADERHPDSQYLPKLHRLSNGVYICSKAIMEERGYFLGSNPFILPIPKICSIDIDEIEDYNIASDAYSWYESVRDEFYSN